MRRVGSSEKQEAEKAASRRLIQRTKFQQYIEHQSPVLTGIQAMLSREFGTVPVICQHL